MLSVLVAIVVPPIAVVNVYVTVGVGDVTACPDRSEARVLDADHVVGARRGTAHLDCR